MAILFGMAAPVFAGTCTVTSTADPNPTVTGTFRYCVTNAFAAGDNETVYFNLPPLSIITLTSSLSITLPQSGSGLVTIAGPAKGGIAISGAGKYQILALSPDYVSGGVTASLTISNLTFTGGYTTGSGGAMSLIFDGPLTLTNTTFFGNYAGGSGSSIATQYLYSLNVTNSTFSGNTGAGGTLAIGTTNTPQPFSITQTTVSGNGSGVVYSPLSAPPLTVTDSIIAANGTSMQCSGCTLDATDYTGANPMLGPLQYNGGNLLETMLPLPGSPVIGLAGDPTKPDERGFPAENPGDAGAVQTKYLTVDTLSDGAGDAGTGACVSAGGICSLREAINFGNFIYGFGVYGPDIAFASALTANATQVVNGVTTYTPAVIPLAAQLPDMTGQVNIVGPGANLLQVSGGGQYGIINVDAGGSLAFNGLTATAAGSASGYALSNYGTLTLANMQVTNMTSSDGGAIGNAPDYGSAEAALVLANSTVSGAVSDSAVALQGPSQILNSTLSGNTSIDTTVSTNTYPVLIAGTTISNNTLDYDGGAGGLDQKGDGQITIVNSIVEGNSGNGNGTLPDVRGAYTDGGGNLINTSQNFVDPGLAPLAYNGGTTQTMLPLPGSPAICTGTAANQALYNLLTDQRGATHSSAYCASTEADAGAVQTSYSALAFVQQPTNTPVSASITPAPTATVTEDGGDAGGIPVPLTLSTGGSGTLAGNATETTVLGGPATFSGLSVTAPSTSNTLDALLNITPQAYAGTPYTLSTASNNFIVEDLATQLVFGNPPASALSAGGRVAYVTVDEQDPNGNIVTTASDPITLSVTSTGGYSAIYTATASSGVATFNLSSVALVPGNYTYTASFSTLTPAVAQETVTLGTPQLTVTSSLIAYGTASATLSASLAYSGRPPTGAVTFQVDSGATVSATCTTGQPPLSCSATYNTAALSATTHTITATIAADANYNTASGSGTLTVTAIAPTIGFTIPNQIYGAAPFQVTATSNSTEAFTYSLVSGNASVTSSGQVTLTGVGAVTIQASQAANGNYAAGTQSASFNVSKASSSTTLSGSANTNNTATLTATVKPQISGTPTGTVTFSNGSTPPVTVNLVNGPATYTTTATYTGPQSFTAIYNGDGNFTASPTSNTVALNFTTAPTIAFNIANQTYSTTPFQVTATSNSTGAFTYSLVSGNASVTSSGQVTLTGVSPVTILASQAANGSYTAGSKTASFTVGQASTRTALTGSINANNTATLAAIVTPQITGTPTGTVSFYDSSSTTPLTTVTYTGGTITYTTAALAPGSQHSYYAVYSGNSNFTTSTSGTLALTVPSPATTVSLQFVSTQLVYPLPPIFGVRITPVGSTAPTGTVTIYDGSQVVAKYPVLAQFKGNVPGLVLPPLNVGKHSLTAVYSGDANYAPGTSAAVPVTVTPGPVHLSLSCPNTKLKLGQTLSCTVNADEGLLPVSGTVNYTVTGWGSGSATLNLSGQVSINFTLPAKGSFTLTVTYAAQGNYQAAQPASAGFSVN